ncbi:MAG: cytochrome c3 family protein [bacterium]
MGCSRSARHGLLNFFFDDVPPLEESEDKAIADSLAQLNLTQETRTDSAIATDPIWSFHPAAEKKECTTCHDQKQSFSLFEEPENLCVSCHDQADATVVHAPVEEGDCVACHNPHGSKYPHLLIYKEVTLCFQCHDEEELKPTNAKYIHEPVESGACTTCHNPHGTINPYMLVEPGKKLCLQCHDAEGVNFLETHAGLEEMVCYECHDPHKSDNEFLIK